MSQFKVAAVQMRSGMDPEKNVADFEALVREASGKGAAYVQTPEMTGALVRDRKRLVQLVRDESRDIVAAKASVLAAELGIHLHVGSTPIALGEDKVANRAFLFGPDGGLIATYDKIHMFDVDLDDGESWRESKTYRPGERTVVAQLPFGTVGLSVCYDVRFPALYREQALAGAEVLTVPAAFTRQTGEAHWHVLLRSRAIENGAYLIAAAQGGRHEDERETYGHSLIVDPWGRVLAEAEHDSPGVIVADIDTAESGKARGKIPNLKNARAFGVHVADAAGDAADHRRAS